MIHLEGHTVSIRTNISGENASGYMYEVICFNKALSDDEINTITNELKLYNPFT